MSLQDQIDAVVALRDFGVASAQKRGRRPEWPYVPVILHQTGGIGGAGYQEQITGRAYATREEAVARAQKSIDARREGIRRALADPCRRAFRRQVGLPEEIGF